MILLLWGVHLIFSFLIFLFTKTSFSPDGRYVCAGSADGNVFVWDLSLSLSSGNIVLSLNPNTDGNPCSIASVNWSSPKGELVSADKQGKCVIWKWRDAPKSWAVFENNVVVQCNDLMYQKCGKVINSYYLIIILKK